MRVGRVRNVPCGDLIRRLDHRCQSILQLNLFRYHLQGSRIPECRGTLPEVKEGRLRGSRAPSLTKGSVGVGQYGNAKSSRIVRKAVIASAEALLGGGTQVADLKKGKKMEKKKEVIRQDL